MVVKSHDFQFLTRCPSAAMYFQTSSTQSNTAIGVYGSPPETSHTSYIREWNGPNQTRLRITTSRPYRVTAYIIILLSNYSRYQTSSASSPSSGTSSSDKSSVSSLDFTLSPTLRTICLKHIINKIAPTAAEVIIQ